MIFAYVYFLKPSPEEDSLVSSTGLSAIPASPTEGNESPDKDFLPLLLSVKNIRLNDAIFSDPSFTALTDSSIELLPEGNEGRPNPFAPLGSENLRED